MKELTPEKTLILTLAVLVLVANASAMVIWRCPEFNLLKCQAIPKGCKSFRMIYIRHGHLECPGCLICVDPWKFNLWSSSSSEKTTKSSVSSRNDSSGRKSRRLQRRRHKGKKKRGRRSKYKMNKTTIRVLH